MSIGCSPYEGYGPCGSCSTCTDALTGVLLRNIWRHAASNLFSEIKDSDRGLIAILADMNRFRIINSTMGDDAGDFVLAEFSSRMLKVLPEGAIAGRYGDDEFAIVVPCDKASGADIESVVGGLLSSLERVMVFRDKPLHAEVSLGVSVYPRHGNSLEDVISKAATALFQSKRKRQPFLVYDKDAGMGDVEDSFYIASMLREAIDKGQFFLNYQPKADIFTGAVVGGGGSSSVEAP